MMKKRQVAPKKRDVSYEVIRVVAMVLVILVHELPICIRDSSNTTTYTVIEALLCVCNALFFLLAGRFAFKMKLDDEKLYKKYYWKKAIGLIIPMLVYMAIKNWHVMVYHQHLDVTPISYVKHFGIALVNGFSYMEYWFLYTLIACLIAAPFLARMIQNMKKRDKKAFFVVGMIMTTLITFIPLLGVEFRVRYFFVGHILLFCLGSMIEEIFESEKSRKILYIIGPVAELINALLITVLHYPSGYKETSPLYSYKETSPLYIIFAISLFLFIKNVIKIPAKSEKLILFLGKHSLAVYMTHFMVIYTLRDLINLPHGVGSFMLASIIVLAVSELIGFVIDSTIIKWLQNLTIKIFKLEKVLK